jgi:hypothetical protein
MAAVRTRSTLYISPIGRLGNNIFQYMAGRLLARAFGHTLVRFKSDCVDSVQITDTSEGPYSFSWSWFCEFVAEHGLDGSLRSHPLASRNLHLSGFFQQSEIYVKNREWLRELFTTENTDYLNLSTRVCDMMAEKGRECQGPVVHIRMGDFQISPTQSFILAPRVYLEVLRAHEFTSLEIVCAPPKSDAERMYVAMFDSFLPQRREASELEDHATLRSAKHLLCSNSTFAWTAAFLGSAEASWMPRIHGFSLEQNLDPLPGSETLREEFVFMETFETGAQYPMPFAGEDIEALCDCIVLTREKEQYHRGLEYLISRDHWVFLEDVDVDAAAQQTLRDAQIVFIYEDIFEVALPQILDQLTSVRLLVLHNADTEPSAERMQKFLDRYPQAHIYAQNNVMKHRRIHSLPMGIQNRMWREVTLEKSPHCVEKQYLALATFFSATHPVRAELTQALVERPFEGLYISPRCDQQQYLANLFVSAFSFCPPGNAHDTHRLWESLFCGSIPIVQSEPFISRLLETMPALPLTVVERFKEETEYGSKLLTILREKNYAFEIPRCLFLKYWALLFDSYRIRNEAPA